MAWVERYFQDILRLTLGSSGSGFLLGMWHDYNYAGLYVQHTVCIFNVGGIDPSSNNPFKCVGEAKDQYLYLSIR